MRAQCAQLLRRRAGCLKPDNSKVYHTHYTCSTERPIHRHTRDVYYVHEHTHEDSDLVGHRSVLVGGKMETGDTAVD